MERGNPRLIRFGPFVTVQDDGRIVCSAGSVSAGTARLVARALVDAADYVEAPAMTFPDSGASCAKIKARDIVAGWPKSRSTSPEFSTVEEYIRHEEFMLVFRRDRGPVYADEKLEEIRQTALYHRHQAEMVDSYLDERESKALKAVQAMDRETLSYVEEVENLWKQFRRWIAKQVPE